MQRRFVSLIVALTMLGAPAPGVAQPHAALPAATPPAELPAADLLAFGDIAAEPPALPDASPPLLSLAPERAAALPVTFDPDARCTPDGRSCIRLETYFDDVCTLIGRAAHETGLDSGFLARLLWKESLFDAAAVSPAGALGIAQFMPGTAKLRGLDDPFNPAKAIVASATYLAELADRFGNPGLAAVAYNGGENRAERFLANPDAILPGETLDYVDAITGHSARVWRDAPPDRVDYRLAAETPFHQACVEQASTRRVREFADPTPPWGVVIATARRRSMAESLGARVRRAHPGLLSDARLRVVRATIPGRGPQLWYTVQAPAGSRREALSFCLRLRRTGAICRIHRN